MKTMVLTTKTNCNSLRLNNLGGAIILPYRLHSHIDTEPSAGVRQWHRRKALCVSDLQMLIGWHTAKTAVYWQIAAVRWIIQPYSGKIWLRHEI